MFLSWLWCTFHGKNKNIFSYMTSYSSISWSRISAPTFNVNDLIAWLPLTARRKLSSKISPTDVTYCSALLWKQIDWKVRVCSMNRGKIAPQWNQYIHIIIIVTWSGVLYHVSWMRSYHRITRDAKRWGWSNGMASSRRRDTVRQIKLLL